jgi:hypothetical protein
VLSRVPKGELLCFLAANHNSQSTLSTHCVFAGRGAHDAYIGRILCLYLQHQISPCLAPGPLLLWQSI